MRKLLLFLFLAGGSLVRADDNILLNGDFSDGLNHWEGDCETPAGATFDAPEVAPTSGIVVKLRHSWTKVTQEFQGDVGEYILTITYALSPDLAFSQAKEDYTNIPGQLEFNRLSQFSSTPGDWVIIVNDLEAQHYNYWKMSTPLTTTVQTIRERVKLDSGKDSTKGLYLIFPPGTGFVNLLNVSLAPRPAPTGGGT